MKMRPPATPIITTDPYFSVWAEDSVLKNTVHWTGKPSSMSGRVFIDGEEYHFLGFRAKGEKIADMTVESVEVDAFSTTVKYLCATVRLTVCFTSPLLIDDLYYASRPITYCKVSYESLDANTHRVSCRFTASEELVLNKRGDSAVTSRQVDIVGVTAIKMGNTVQRPLWRSGDDIRIDWGYLYLAACGSGKAFQATLDGMCAISIEAEVEGERLFLFAYDDIESINYFGEPLKAYWKKDGKGIEEAIAEAVSDYESVMCRACELSERIRASAIAAGGEKYAELLLLCVRQVMAAHKLVIDKEGQPLFISKECHSNGCGATVDVTYPSSPIFLLYNTELLKGMLRPILRYAASDEWCFDFAPHDVGQYPLLLGQVYGAKRENCEVKIDYNMQMPVEECGNMLILFAAITDAEHDVSFAAQHIDTIKRWNNYLIKYGLDPENQLCTDDFAGHLAHNVNLSIKAIMGIVGYSRILERLGESETAEKMFKTAREYAASLIERAKNEDGSYRLAYDRPETFSLKYNAIWDKIWNTKIFPESFFEGEIERYKKELLPYGVPLDSRKKYTKADWLLWAASFAESREDFELLTGSLWSAYNTMRTRVPMGDWYCAETADVTVYHEGSEERAFRNRTVVGGLFIKLMLDKR